jgi:hypothetical protein
MCGPLHYTSEKNSGECQRCSAIVLDEMLLTILFSSYGLIATRARSSKTFTEKDSRPEFIFDPCRLFIATRVMLVSQYRHVGKLIGKIVQW